MDANRRNSYPFAVIRTYSHLFALIRADLGHVFGACIRSDSCNSYDSHPFALIRTYSHVFAVIRADLGLFAIFAFFAICE